MLWYVMFHIAFSVSLQTADFADETMFGISQHGTWLLGPAELFLM